MKKIIIIVLVFSLLNVQANNFSIQDSITKNKHILIFTKNGLSVDGKKGYVHKNIANSIKACLLYTSPSPRDAHESRMPASA